MRKATVSNALLVLALVVGLALVLYPSVSNWWNSQHQTQAVAEYSDEVAQLDQADFDQLWADADAYNAALVANADRFSPTEDERVSYQRLLRIDDTGIMGYIEIPSIDVRMPIYHGTDDAALQVGAGHLEGSSLPTGGKGTHCVLSGHRGLPSSRLFTDLDTLAVGDTFVLHVLDRTMTYEVDQIVTVDPYDLDDLAIDPDQDYCTLVTCTPYGINTQRLLVRGHRVANRPAAQADQSETGPSPFEIAGGVALIGALLVGAGCALRMRAAGGKRRKNS